MRTFRHAWLALGALWIAAVVYLSLIPPPPQPLPFSYLDKLEHALAYGFLMLWFSHAYQKIQPRIVAAALLIFLGIVLEYLQRMTGYREFSYADMLANGAGVLLGWALAYTAGAWLKAKFKIGRHDRKNNSI